MQKISNVQNKFSSEFLIHKVKQMFKHSIKKKKNTFFLADVFGALQIKKVTVSATASLSPLLKNSL